MKKPKIEINYKREKRWRYEIEDVFRKYLNHEVTFGIVLNRLNLRKILEIKKQIGEEKGEGGGK